MVVVCFIFVLVVVRTWVLWCKLIERVSCYLGSIHLVVFISQTFGTSIVGSFVVESRLDRRYGDGVSKGQYTLFSESVLSVVLLCRYRNRRRVRRLALDGNGHCGGSFLEYNNAIISISELFGISQEFIGFLEWDGAV